MLVQNEADIVGSVLKDAEKWADKIFILDNGSTDGTWEIIQSMSNNCITPWKQYFGAYHNGLRAEVYNNYKHLSEPGDWWCFKLDAYEFYYDNPRVLLSTLPKKDGLLAKNPWTTICAKKIVNRQILMEILKKTKFSSSTFEQAVGQNQDFFKKLVK